MSIDFKLTNQEMVASGNIAGTTKEKLKVHGAKVR